MEGGVVAAPHHLYTLRAIRLYFGANKNGEILGVRRVGVPSAKSGNFAIFADSSCCVALSALELALSVHYIQKMQTGFALFQHVPLSWC